MPNVHPNRPAADGAPGLLGIGAAALRVPVLDADPDLARDLDDDQRRMAARVAWAPSIALDSGPYDFFPRAESGALGALILSGVITVRLALGERGHVELLTAGDVVSPWIGYDAALTVAPAVTATVLVPTEIAFLNRRFSERTARWPEIHGAVVNRLIERARRLAFQAAVNSLPRTDERLELTLWQIAERIGRVTRGGVALRLPITQAALGELVGAQRPSVTTALRRLVESGRVSRTGRHSWLLHGSMPGDVMESVRSAGVGA